MAIYNNREVTVISPTRPVTSPDSVTIRHNDGQHESVLLSSIKYTSDEKKHLQKMYPSVFDQVSTIDDSAIDAVRQGKAPEDVLEEKKLESKPAQVIKRPFIK